MAATIFAFIFTCLFVHFSTISFGALYFEPLSARNDSSTYKYVTVSNITSLNNIDDRYWTLHSWYYYSQSEFQQYPGIFSNRASGGAALFSGIFYGLVNSQDYSPFVQCGANFWGSYKSAYPNDTTISMNDTWLHSVIVHENDTLSYYLNGKLYYNKSSNLILEDSIISNENSSINTFYIGWDKWNPNQARWEGYLSDIAIFKRVLTEYEIELLYNESPLLHNSILLNDNDLIHYWPLNERYSSEDGQYVYDIISNSHGILGNTSMVDNHDPIIVSGLYDPDSWNTYEPSAIPSNEPTMNPSMNPSSNPSMNPSDEPSVYPSNNPTSNPSLFPSMQPSNEPSIMPTAAVTTTSQTTFEASQVTTMHATTTTAAASTTVEQSSLISTTENENEQNNNGGGSSSSSSSSGSGSSDITSTLIDVLIICAIICVIITTFGILLTFVCWQRRSKNKFNKNHMALSLNENDTNNNDNNDKISRINSTSAIINTNDTNALIGDLSPSSVNTPNGENRQFPIVNNNNKNDDEMLSIVNSIVNNDIEMGTVQQVLPQAPQIRQQPMHTLGLNMNNEANGEGEGGSGSAAADGNGNDIDDMYVTGGARGGGHGHGGGMGVGMHDTNFVNNVTWENWDEEMFSKWMKNMLEQTEYGQFSNKMINNFMNSFNKIDLNGKILKLWVLQAKNGNQFGNIDINILLQKLQTKIDYNKESLVWDAIGQGILDLVQK